MRHDIRVIVLNTDESYGAVMRADLLSIDGVKIVAEIDEPSLLVQAIKRFPAEVVLVHLDPDPETLLQAAGTAANQRPDLPVFALSSTVEGPLVLSAMRAGLREFLTKPTDRKQLSEALAKVVQSRPEQRRRGRVFAVIGTAGGVGATTLTANLGVELADVTARSVVIVDLDVRFGQLATFLDVQPSFTIADLCDSPERPEPQMIEKAVTQHPSGVHVLARPNHVAQADLLTAAQCASVLGALQELYDYVVIDGPSRFDSSARAVLDMADLSFLIVQLTVPSVRNAQRIIEAARANGYNPERFRVICNRVGRDAGLLSTEHVETTLNAKVCLTIPDDWRAVSTAINMGEALAASNPKSRARLAIRELAERISSGDPSGELDNAAKKTGGILSKVFSDS
jgi:pilus assembly protein CpaE